MIMMMMMEKRPSQQIKQPMTEIFNYICTANNQQSLRKRTYQEAYPNTNSFWLMAASSATAATPCGIFALTHFSLQILHTQRNWQSIKWGRHFKMSCSDAAQNSGWSVADMACTFMNEQCFICVWFICGCVWRLYKDAFLIFRRFNRIVAGDL